MIWSSLVGVVSKRHQFVFFVFLRQGFTAGGTRLAVVNLTMMAIAFTLTSRDS